MHIIQRNDHKRGIATVCGEIRHINSSVALKNPHPSQAGEYNKQRSVTVFMERQFPIDDTAAIEAHKQKLYELSEQMKADKLDRYPATTGYCKGKPKD